MKILKFAGSSLEDLREFPLEVRRESGRELDRVQFGLMPTDWKPMPQVGPGVYELRVHVLGDWSMAMSDDPDRDDDRIAESCGNVFADLGLPPDEAEILALRSELMNRLEQVMQRRGWSAAEAAVALAIDVPRAADLMQGKWQDFSLETLIALAVRAGLEVRMQLTEAA